MRPKLLVSLLLASATIALYAPVRTHHFVDFDDITMVTENPDLAVKSPGQALATAFTSTRQGNWTPLTLLSQQLDRALYGDDPAGYLLGNVALHAAAAVVLFLALARLTGAGGPSAFVAAVFALHPLHVESVAWAAERKDSLCGLFTALTLLAYARYVERPGVRRYAGVALALVGALLSKSMAVTLPFVLLLLDAWPLGRLGSRSAVRRAVLEKLPLLVPVLAVCVVTFLAQREAGAIPSSERLPLAWRLENALDAYVVYLRQSVWPSGLAYFYPHPGGSLSAGRLGLDAAVLAALSALALLRRHAQPYLLVGWLWFLGVLFPTIGVVQVGGQAHADRYMYLPLIGLSIAVAWGGVDLLGRRRAGRVALVTAAAAGLVACAAVTASLLPHWSDALAMHRRGIAIHPRDAMEHHRLASALRVAGRVEEATREYRRAIQLDPRSGAPYIGLGDVYARAGHLEQAVAAYRRGLARMPEHTRGHANLGLALVRLHRYDEARPHLERALELQQQEIQSAEVVLHEVAPPHIALGDVLAHQGDLPGAIEHYRRAVEIDPSLERARSNLGIALAHSRRYAEALPVLEEALRSEPDSVLLHSALGMSCAGVGRDADALRHYRRAYDLEPTSLVARTDLAWLLATSADPGVRDPAAAIQLAQPLVETGAAPIGLLDALAAAYAASGRFAEAVDVAERAEDLAMSQDRRPLAGVIRRRRNLYAAGRPYVADPATSDAGS